MRELIRAYLTLALSLLVLTLIVLPVLEPKSPSFIVGVVAATILTLFITALIVVAKRILREEVTLQSSCSYYWLFKSFIIS